MKTEMTDILRFHLNFFSVSLTKGSIISAVSSAKMIGNETGKMKIIIKMMINILSVMIKLRLLSHFDKGHSSRLIAISIITK